MWDTTYLRQSQEAQSCGGRAGNWWATLVGPGSGSRRGEGTLRARRAQHAGKPSLVLGKACWWSMEWWASTRSHRTSQSLRLHGGGWRRLGWASWATWCGSGTCWEGDRQRDEHERMMGMRVKVSRMTALGSSL